MSGLTYDAGALLAAEAGGRRLWALHRRALERSHVPTVPAAVFGQVWRGGPQPSLSRLVAGCLVEPLDETGARLAGALMGAASRSDVVDASVVAGALRRGDAVVTSGRDDLTHLASAAGRRVDIIAV